MKDDRMLAEKLLGITPLMRRRIDASLRHLGERLVEPTHFPVMLHLRSRPYSLGGLAEKLEVSRPSMSKTVTALVKRGWVERVRLERDRRVVELYLTKDGADAVEQMHELAVCTVIEMLSPLTPGERRRLADSLDMLYRALGESTMICHLGQRGPGTEMDRGGEQTE
jgi:DNA-binding MarR family transcriptional regulator